MRTKRPPSGAGLTGIRALSLSLASSGQAHIIIDCSTCQHLQQLRVREARSSRRLREGLSFENPRSPLVFVPPVNVVWTHRLTVLDLGDLEMRQTAPLSALASLICSLPCGDHFLPGNYPALKYLIFTGSLKPGAASNAFVQLHELESLVHVEATGRLVIRQWNNFPQFKMPPRYQTLAMRLTDRVLVPGQFMGAERTALPLITHLWCECDPSSDAACTPSDEIQHQI